VGALLERRSGTGRRQRVLDVVAADGDERAHTLGTEDGGDARGAAAPVVAGEGDRGQREGVEEVDEVLGDRRLLGHAWGVHVEEARGPVAPQVRHEDAEARGGERPDRGVPCPHVVGKPCRSTTAGPRGGPDSS
jgi:hypothetical protein